MCTALRSLALNVNKIRRLGQNLRHVTCLQAQILKKKNQKVLYIVTFV